MLRRNFPITVRRLLLHSTHRNVANVYPIAPSPNNKSAAAASSSGRPLLIRLYSSSVSSGDLETRKESKELAEQYISELDKDELNELMDKYLKFQEEDDGVLLLKTMKNKKSLDSWKLHYDDDDESGTTKEEKPNWFTSQWKLDMKKKLLKLEEKMGLHRFISKQIEEARLLGNSYCNLAYVTNKLLEPELRIGCRINNYLRIEIVLDHHLLSDDLKKKLKTMQDDFNKQSEKGS